MSKKRVVVTGLGVVSCFGNDVNIFHDSLVSGKNGVKTITKFPCDEMPTRFAGVITDFDPEGYIEKKTARRVDSFIAYTLVAGKKALEHAGIKQGETEELDITRCGIIVGSGMGGLTMFQDAVITLRDKGVRRMTPFFIPYVITNMAGGLLAMDYGFMGPNYSISTACATGNYAIINAAEHIRNGTADLMVCGGVEAPINSIGLAGFCACKALSERNDSPESASRPWDKARDGFVMGEGAGVLILESLEHARARGAQIYAEYLGGAFSCDAHHMTEPREDGEGIALCMKNAFIDAGIPPSRVNYINAHATSTPLGDMAEVNAIKKVLGDTTHIHMNATKSMIGHALGGAAGLEGVAVIKAIETGEIHPTINLQDPEEGLDFIVSDKAANCEIDVAMSNSFGFGGHNATVLFTGMKNDS